MMLVLKYILASVIAMQLLSTSGYSSQNTNKIYYPGEYPITHWAMEQKTWESSPNLIALASYGESEYAIYLNPTDSRATEVSLL